jgi:lipopolysaccharide transport system ATP-binding protein
MPHQAEPAVSPAHAVPPDAAPVLISVENVGKAYRLFERPQDRLKEQLLFRLGRRYGHDFWAVRGVSLELRRGERVGVIGRNGSGKSTVLQMIAGTLAPTEGRIGVRGRVAALLELGSGFNPNFTGRENVLLNGTLLGLSREQIEQRFDDIASFADIGEFLEQPVKTYSSGMLVRLAFAVATAVEADVLLVDEALAVGDVFFRQKCYERLDDLRARGTAVVLVSHSMGEVEQFCQRTLLLDQGRPLFLGPSTEAVNRYYLLQQGPASAAVRRPAAAPQAAQSVQAGAGPQDWPAAAAAFLDLAGLTQVTSGGARCTAFAICDPAGRPCRHFAQGERALFYYEFETTEAIDVPVGGLTLRSDRAVIVHGKTTLEYGSEAPRRLPPGSRVRFRQSVTLSLAVGEYTVSPGLAALDSWTYDRRSMLTHDQLSAAVTRLCHMPNAASFTVALRPPAAPVQLLHHGVADLPGDCTVAVAAAARDGAR